MEKSENNDTVNSGTSDKRKHYFLSAPYYFFKAANNYLNALKSKTEKFLYQTVIIFTIFGFLAGIAGAVLIYYFYDTDKTDITNWGDTFGGLTMPFITFVSVLLFAATLHFQRKDLQLTREEMERSRKEMKESSNALIFDNFISSVKFFNEQIEKCELTFTGKDGKCKTLSGNNAFVEYVDSTVIEGTDYKFFYNDALEQNLSYKNEINKGDFDRLYILFNEIVTKYQELLSIFFTSIKQDVLVVLLIRLIIDNKKELVVKNKDFFQMILKDKSLIKVDATRSYDIAKLSLT